MTRQPLAGRALVLEDFPQPAVARVLSPNGRAHWAVRKLARESVSERIAVEARRCGLERMRGLVEIQPVWTFPRKGRHDPDNLSTGVLKVVLDSLVRGWWLADDSQVHVRLMPPVVRVERGVRRLELRFEVEAA